MKLLLLLLLLGGCIAPEVHIHKKIEVHTSGTVTVNMNSGTKVDADVEQDVSPELTIPLVP